MNDFSEAPPPQRPVLVWIICLFFFVCGPLGLLAVIALPLLAAYDAIPMPEAQRQIIQSLGYVYYGIKFLNYVLVLTWAVLLFQLKRLSLYFLFGSIALGVVNQTYHLMTAHSTASASVLVYPIAAIGWTINLALLYYNWDLFRKGVLR